ncbi:MAG: hypothetical protein ABIH63_02325 [archaeon]
MKRGLSLIFVFVLLVDVCSATTIHGTVYDNSLRPVKDTVVEVNSIPLQRFIAKDGTYSFNLIPGDYVITAKHDGLMARESISIEDDSGDYVIDLFLFPTFEEEEDLLNETDFDVGNPYPKEVSYTALVVTILVVVALVLFFLFKSKLFKKKSKVEMKEEKKEVDDLDNVIDFIKEEGGRVTQKDIRRKFPLSEAKISLIISELEHKGLIEKIKKGRGNIIVLKK